jgi:hypothetical protein
MEANGILQPDSDADLFVLHCVFLPRINKSLGEFTRAWNMHPIRTAKNWSPRQIMINSMIREADLLEALDVPVEEWGIDYEGPIPIPEDLIGTVEVTETLCPLNEHDLQQFKEAIDTDTRFEDLGIEHYMHCKELLESLLS